jgi:WD40-like Beta Propeller Repeat
MDAFLRNKLGFALAFAILVAAVAAACSDGGGGSATPGSGGTGSFVDASSDVNPGGSAGTASDGSVFDTGQNGDVVGLTIEPSTDTLTVVDNQAATVQLQAVAEYEDGHSATVDSAVWTTDLPHIAGVDAYGLLTAAGDVGGDVTVSAAYSGLTAEATVRVNIKQLVNPAGVSQSDIDSLTTATTPDTATQFQYPYDGTVFPRGLQAPLLMWNGTAPGDLYLLTLKNDYVDISVVGQADPPSRFEILASVWVTVTESGAGGPLTASLRRLSSGAATYVGEQTWRIASGSMRGSVYYWSVTWGRVVRIKPGASEPEDFLGAAGVTDGCTTCHTVSADGSTLVMGQGESAGDSQASTFDLVGNQLVLSGQGRAWANPAVSPDGKYLVRNHGELPGYPGPGTGDGVFDTHTGAKVATPTGLEGQYLGMPAFSPDGSLLAYTTLPSPGTLGVYDYDGSGPTLSNARSLVSPGGDPATQYIAWPTLTPDANSVVYVRSDRLQQYGDRYPSNLYLASTDTGEEVRLANLNGDTYPFVAGDLDRNCSYEPTSAPIAAGGYFWVVFTSRRTYGNIVTYGADPDAIQQLWVAAIDMNPQPGQDPSHPAFWLPGQEPTTKNMRGFWALDPCKSLGTSCGAASECCSQICESTDGGKACGEPSESQCSPSGGICETAEDCCGTGNQCINKHCAEPPPA